MSKTLLILGGIIVILGLWLMNNYNTLVNLDENTDNSFAKIETQYQRRFDLIPNLVNTVKGAANFERGTFTDVTEARSAWAKAGTANQKIAAANQLESTLSKLIVTFENYPQLRATQAFRDLMVELEGTENRIAFARNEYNDIATEYNKSTRRFPRSLVAAVFSFESERTLFEAAEGSEVAPIVDLSTDPAPAVTTDMTPATDTVQ